MKFPLALLSLFILNPAVAQDAAMNKSADVMGSTVISWTDLAPNTSTKNGARRAVFDLPTATLDKFHLHVSKLNPGENTGPLHRHPQEELIIIKEGTLEINIDGKKQTAEAGAMVFYAANENENMTNIGKVPAVYYVYQFYTAKTPEAEKVKE